MLSYRLREAMDIRRKTQERLAAETGVSQSHISRIVNGEREPTVDIAVRLAYALDVSLDWLCGLPPAPDSPLEPDEGELLASYRAITTESARAIALNLVREMGGLS
jgi:transcriptional regulator with XRE-family HTH domain